MTSDDITSITRVILSSFSVFHILNAMYVDSERPSNPTHLVVFYTGHPEDLEFDLLEPTRLNVLEDHVVLDQEYTPSPSSLKPNERWQLHAAQNSVSLVLSNTLSHIRHDVVVDLPMRVNVIHRPLSFLYVGDGLFVARLSSFV
jgi:hypothetical protein